MGGAFYVNIYRVSVLTIIAKSFILNVWQDSEFASLVDNNLQKKPHLRCLTQSKFNFAVINDFRKKIHLRCCQG